MTDAVVRLFVAIYPPASEAEAMLRAMRKLHAAPHRETPVTQVHMTLQFVGEIDRSEQAGVIESVERSVAGLAAFSLTPERLITLPKRGRPRLIAARTDAPGTLLEIQRRLATRLARNPRDRAGDRFTPHFTLCRFTHAARPDPADAPIRLPPFRVEQVYLMRSVLLPEGAEHAPVHQAPLLG
ncbi:MAG: RNA 2',3'-cyclic phosphodiesterase [Phycisphaerae bacterium]|nr:RNA 2',3'-cyclic phosphodiesterase [Phycisphaerae bacterium]